MKLICNECGKEFTSFKDMIYIDTCKECELEYEYMLDLEMNWLIESELEYIIFDNEE